MSLQEALILLATHGIPILFFTYMATDVLLRNQKRVEHILLSLISVCYLLLFAEEYVRNQVAIEYSPILSAIWLSSVGIVIPGLGFHFLVKFTRLDRKMPRFIYPYIFYVPVIFALLNVITGAKLISAQEFSQVGMWNFPVYNTGYYIAMTASIINNMLYLIPLFIAKSTAAVSEQKVIYNQLIFGIIISIIWHAIFGYMNFESLPPYPYLYSGIIWCYFLRHTMKNHDFLNLYDKRYEKLFNMNPDAILLIDQHLVIKHANQGSKALFSSLQLEFSELFHLFSQEMKEAIQARRKISDYETEIFHHNQRITLLVNADYVLVDNEVHVLLILRDITVQKKHQEEIQFLAYHDPLTRLPNRRYFYEKLDETLQEAKVNNEKVALLLVDLDKFKFLNDTYGHLAGDEALKKVAQIISKTVAEHRGTAARMGGDEFILFLRDSPTQEKIEHIALGIQNEFARYMSQYGETPVGLSIGMSSFPIDGQEGQALINIADQAMYNMKRSRFSTTESN